MSTNSNKKIDTTLLSLIRRITPTIIANDLISVQPIANPFKKTVNWLRIGIDGSSGFCIYKVRSNEIRTWVEEQPISMWKFHEFSMNDGSLDTTYIFTEEMESWFILRWS